MSKLKESITTKKYLQDLADVFFTTAPPRYKCIAARFYRIIHGKQHSNARTKCSFDCFASALESHISELEKGYNMSLGGADSPRKQAMKQKIMYDIDFLRRLKMMTEDKGVQRVMAKYTAQSKVSPTKEMEDLLMQVESGLHIKRQT